jgi:ElaB/YqjD/DUF883 family membrane-anchored ribosome-binding protein
MREVTTDKLMSDLRAVLEDAEALLTATAGQAGERIQAARERAKETVRVAKERLVDAQDEVSKRARDAAKDADKYVHDNPWQAVGIAAGLAFLVGVLISRR